MKKILGLLLLAGLISPAFPTQAESADILACDDLAIIADDLAYISDSMAEGVPIEEGDELDAALVDVVDALYEVAEIEENEVLYDATLDLDDAWVNMDREAFVDALDIVVDEFDLIYVYECGE
ncbi:MAG: hypothetical protein VKJ86_04875 [Synechococcus sp.]|nr:hypothetical protein [Synechococcus sp.]